MISIRPPADFPWLEGCFWEVPHALGQTIAICRVDIPTDATVPREAVGEAELARAMRFGDAVEAVRFLASHAILRAVLASALGVAQSRLALTADKNGKPRLAGDPILFNMARSGAVLLIGLSDAREIGVDVELVRDVPLRADLARSHLSRREHAALQAEGSPRLSETFLQVWTRKEACVKAAGLGLAMPLRNVDVGLAADLASRVVEFRSGHTRWAMRVASLPMPRGVVAAAAVIE
jgi:4'-phosphopantetheinyl transferase